MAAGEADPVSRQHPEWPPVAAPMAPPARAPPARPDAQSADQRSRRPADHRAARRIGILGGVASGQTQGRRQNGGRRKRLSSSCVLLHHSGTAGMDHRSSIMSKLNETLPKSL